MYFGLSEDQSFFQDNVLKFLDDNVGLDIVKSITSKADKNLQQEIHSGLTNLGYTNMLIPEEYGGLGLDLLFATAVSQSLGAGIAPVPFAGSYVMAPIAITNGGNIVNPTIIKKKEYMVKEKIMSLETSNKINKILRKVVTEKEGTPHLANMYRDDIER